MIARIFSLVLLLYAVGFVYFAFTLGRPAAANARQTDAAVVLTGGPGRIEHGIDVVRQGKARRLLVAGADPLVRKADLARRIPAGAVSPGIGDTVLVGCRGQPAQGINTN